MNAKQNRPKAGGGVRPAASQPRPASRSWIKSAATVGGLVLLMLVLLAGFVSWWRVEPGRERRNRTPSEHAILADAQRSLADKDFVKAEALSREVIRDNPSSSSALLIAAQAYAGLGEFERAIEMCDRVPQDFSSQSEVAAWVPCELYLRTGRLTQAVARLQRLVARFPMHVEGRRRLISALDLCGRRWETQSHLLALLQQGQVDLPILMSLGETARMIDSRQRLTELAEQHPQDPLPLLGLSRLDLAMGHPLPPIVEQLRRVTQLAPHVSEGWARLGEALGRQSDLSAGAASEAVSAVDEFAQWSENLDKAHEEHPEVWMVRGNYAEQTGQLDAGVRCYYEALHRDPNHVVAHYQLGTLLQRLGRAAEARQLLERHQQLAKLVRAIDRLAGKAPTLEELLEPARITRAGGRLWEAWGWYGMARAASPQHPLANQAFQELAQELQQLQPPQTLLSHQPAQQVDWSTLPLPAFRTQRPSSGLAASPQADLRKSGQGEPPNPDSTSSIQFKEQASECGLQFSYFSSPHLDADGQPSTAGKYLYEFGGGGVAVLDADLDGWPDVYFTQGCAWPPNDGQSTYVNTLFRNHAGTHFTRMPTDKAPADNGFGQGVAVGDFNSDGFPDLYVANIGPNRLYVNNGDGSFSDATLLLDAPQAAGSDEQWTTSCLMADINGDGHPDIYDVNYLEGDEIFTRICTWPEGKLRMCGPATYSPAQDQLWINSGSSRFQNSADALGVTIPPGNGLGIVAGVFDSSALQEPQSSGISGNVDTPRQLLPLQLFIANDQQANFLLQYTHSTQTEAADMRESALLMGLAYGARGSAQACMGVAAGDANNDGALDLFVTNYYQESNALYVQQAPNSFADRSQEAHLQEPSFSMLGFGTQFLDADLDGQLDLVLTNGHLDDFSYLGQPYQMRSQFFRNTGQGTFQELSGDQLGPFFSQLGRGRSIARLDWNADGLEDFIVGQLDGPSSLLTNHTQTSHHWIAFELHGVSSSRDAIGAVVTLQPKAVAAADSVPGTSQLLSLTRQLTGGDGYQASNQRRLVFGLRAGQQIEHMTIRWQSGLVQQVKEPLAADRVYAVVEGHSPTALGVGSR